MSFIDAAVRLGQFHCYHRLEQEVTLVFIGRDCAEASSSIVNAGKMCFPPTLVVGMESGSEKDVREQWFHIHGRWGLRDKMKE